MGKEVYDLVVSHPIPLEREDQEIHTEITDTPISPQHKCLDEAQKNITEQEHLTANYH